MPSFGESHEIRFLSFNLVTIIKSFNVRTLFVGRLGLPTIESMNSRSVTFL